jgi:hypothetical protein
MKNCLALSPVLLALLCALLHVDIPKEQSDEGSAAAVRDKVDADDIASEFGKDASAATKKYQQRITTAGQECLVIASISGVVETLGAGYNYDQENKALSLKTDSKIKVTLCGVTNPPDATKRASITVAYASGTFKEFKSNTVFIEVKEIDYGYATKF